MSVQEERPPEQTTEDLLQRALIFLEWLAEHDGECLADYQSVRNRLARLVVEVRGHLVNVSNRA